MDYNYDQIQVSKLNMIQELDRISKKNTTAPYHLLKSILMKKNIKQAGAELCHVHGTQNNHHHLVHRSQDVIVSS